MATSSCKATELHCVTVGTSALTQKRSHPCAQVVYQLTCGMGAVMGIPAARKMPSRVM